MDGALQASIGLMADSNDIPGTPSVPFALESLQIISPCVKEMVAWVRYSKNSRSDHKIIKLDIDLCDLEGNICVQMQGFSARILTVDRLNNKKTTAQFVSGSKAIMERAIVSAFDSAFYQKLIGDVLNHQVSIDEAAARG
jgi:hypothetical protein